MGASRGGELALLLAATFPHLIHGAIGLVPSASVYPAPAAELRAWTLHGKASAARGDPRRAHHRPGAHRRRGRRPRLGLAGEREQIERRLAAHRFRFPTRAWSTTAPATSSPSPSPTSPRTARPEASAGPRARTPPPWPTSGRTSCASSPRASGSLTRRTRRPQPIRTNRAPGGVAKRPAAHVASGHEPAPDPPGGQRRDPVRRARPLDHPGRAADIQADLDVSPATLQWVPTPTC